MAWMRGVPEVEGHAERVARVAATLGWILPLVLVLVFREARAATLLPSDLPFLSGRRAESGAQQSAVPHTSPSRWLPGSPLDLNLASEEDLRMLPAVGPHRAEAILSLRRQRGCFASVDELVEVRGIGAKTLENLRPWITAAGCGREAHRDRRAKDRAASH